MLENMSNALLGITEFGVFNDNYWEEFNDHWDFYRLLSFKFWVFHFELKWGSQTHSLSITSYFETSFPLSRTSVKPS